ncbi:hypothetical protein GCM10027187_40050 [Streptosporangium sandarakinum]|uniref:Uncharacterized protein n=1 Tax=Streptosporangium sandarakinum TaxID=1260955 RepID=A0A852VBQ1_9ACTN|nr:hypothetical protein [Streptosporangium sandarakinum]NYF44663.1 hypothetical protein [Streptosporangium sandarakinum]
MGRESCSLSGCDRPHHARGLCHADYARFAAHGLPFPREAVGAPAGVAPPPERRDASARFRRFLQLNGLGWTAQRIATEMSVSVRTVERYRAAARHPDFSEETVSPMQPPAPDPGAGLDLSDARHREHLARHLLQVAMHLACMVRDEAPEDVAAYLAALSPAEREHLPIILAALVDVDRTEEELLAWITWDAEGRALPGVAAVPAAAAAAVERPRPRALRLPQTTAECPSFGALRRHRANGEKPCDACLRLDADRKHAAYHADASRAPAA